VHGLALFMIVGVALRMLPALFDLPRVGHRRAWWAFGLLTAGVLGEVGLFLAYRRTGQHALAAGLMLPWSMLAAGAALVVTPWRPWRPFPRAERSGKFVRAAFGWLGVSLAMLLLLPAYQAAAGLPFSHAYYGATRHAITVGFISLMIMGMAARFVPTLNGSTPAASRRSGGRSCWSTSAASCGSPPRRVPTGTPGPSRSSGSAGRWRSGAWPGGARAWHASSSGVPTGGRTDRGRRARRLSGSRRDTSSAMSSIGSRRRGRSS
jgi:hypothetical protein